MTSVYEMEPDDRRAALEVRGLTVSSGSRQLVQDVGLSVPEGSVVALVGPSGCGKTTLLKSLNRMNDLNPEVQVEGEVYLFGETIYGPEVDPAEVRRRIGMVSQKPTPFPTSVFENVAFGPRVHGLDQDIPARVERSLRGAGLWEELRDRLFESAVHLSEGQKQRLCIARALAVEPEVLLMDEPASSLDPGATRKIEALIGRLKTEYTIVLVTHNLQQAARASDYTAVFQDGELVEFGPTPIIFTNPREPATEAFITGRGE